MEGSVSLKVRAAVDKTRPGLAMRTDCSAWLLVRIAMVVNKTKEKKLERSLVLWLLGWDLHMCL